jgi:ATP-dependent DNA helicase PIF1
VAAPVVQVAGQDNLTFSPFALNALNLMENTNHSLFITGKAGTGKSTLLKYFIKTTQKKTVVVAPTGIAALNVRGQTIHSFFRFPPGLLVETDLKMPREPLLYRQLQTLIVDEISMVRADVMDMMDHFLRRVRGNQSPYGGVQIVLFGDPYQLPPVVPEKEIGEFLENTYGGHFFFNAPGYAQARVTKIELDHIYRQNDPTFVSVLNQIRVGQQNSQDMEILNHRYNPGFEPEDGDGYFMLTTTNQRAAEINLKRLAQLPGPEYVHQATVIGEFDQRTVPVESELHLKLGAQIMMLRNDSSRRWVNGSIGWVTKVGTGAVEVRLYSSGTTVEVSEETWENIKYEYDSETNTIIKKVRGSFTQFALKLSWAMTIHKSQGQTFEKVMIDLDGGAFADGQTYVALSRCKSLEGIVLKKEVRHGDIKISQRVHEYMQR